MFIKIKNIFKRFPLLHYHSKYHYRSGIIDLTTELIVYSIFNSFRILDRPCLERPAISAAWVLFPFDFFKRDTIYSLLHLLT